MENLDALLAQSVALSQALLWPALLISLASALVCGVIAARRQARWVFWSVMGFAFGPFAVPFVFWAKPKSPPSAGKSD